MIQSLKKTPIEDEWWAAVMARDRSYDGVFYYSVITTGVYCRPSCPARLARRENVRFYANADGAERAGFRPCKRCGADHRDAAARHVEMVARACRRIEAADDPLSLRELASGEGLSPCHFQRIFKSVVGVSPKAYAIADRQKRVRVQLNTSATVTEAIHGSGFNSYGRFYANSSEMLGMTPTSYRSGGAGESIRFAIGECSLGSILIAASDKGVCAILLGDDPEELVHDLENRFPRATLIGGDESFEKLTARVIGYVEAPGGSLDLPLDIRGTAFQHRVWTALSSIPFGETATYAEVAERIGQPKAVRAVANACGANNLAVAIPCHRVIRNNGDLSGYRWGVERKRALLDKETKR